MRRWLQWMGRGVAGLLLCMAAAVLAFDIFIVRPHVVHIEQVIAAATPQERRPPAAVRDVLHRAHGDRLAEWATRDAFLHSMRDGERMSHLRRVLLEGGVALMLPLHLSGADLETAFLASAYMGNGVRGFTAASDRYLGIPLERVDTRQTAMLIAIANAPSFYLGHPERLERRVQWLLSRPPSTGL